MARGDPSRPLGILWVLGSETLDPAVPRTNGVEVLFARAAPLVDRERFAVTVAYPDHGPLAGRFDEAGLRRLPFPPRRNYDPRVAADLEAAVRRSGARVVHTHSGPRDLPAALVARLHGAAHLTTRHVAYRDMAVPRWRVRGYEAVDAACARLGSHFVAITEHGRRVLTEGQGVPAAQVSVVPNGHPLPGPETLLDPAEARRRLGVSPGAPVVGMAARLEPHKGADVLLRAAAAVRADFPGLVVLIAGTGPEAARLEGLAADLGLAAQVRFLGFVRELGVFYDALDCFVLPSRGAEGLPNVLCEALSRGRACVATRVQGVPEVVLDGEGGRLVPPGDVPALAAALREALGDPARRAAWGAAGHAHVAARYALPVMVAAYQDLYERLAAGDGR
jgi:glycosyltransferase involved in cell wall biosynthesis